MALEDYKKKRKFDRTPEPEAKLRETGRNIFVIQEHWTKTSEKKEKLDRVHWDLRLEKGEVLKSWAVPKGVPEKLGIKRLAVPTEDHPVDYAGFEGVIPGGEYGAGTVKIWDSGTYEKKEWNENKIEVFFHGKKISGLYVMVKTKLGWLIFKKE
jgi:bifunctional non-homologous end joining protein LigD